MRPAGSKGPEAARLQRAEAQARSAPPPSWNAAQTARAGSSGAHLRRPRSASCCCSIPGGSSERWGKGQGGSELLRLRTQEPGAAGELSALAALRHADAVPTHPTHRRPRVGGPVRAVEGGRGAVLRQGRRTEEHAGGPVGGCLLASGQAAAAAAAGRPPGGLRLPAVLDRLQSALVALPGALGQLAARRARRARSAEWADRAGSSGASTPADDAR